MREQWNQTARRNIFVGLNPDGKAKEEMNY
jgi:hypothetical protein